MKTVAIDFRKINSGEQEILTSLIKKLSRDIQISFNVQDEDDEEDEEDKANAKRLKQCLGWKTNILQPAILRLLL